MLGLSIIVDNLFFLGEFPSYQFYLLSPALCHLMRAYSCIT